MEMYPYINKQDVPLYQQTKCTLISTNKMYHYINKQNVPLYQQTRCTFEFLSVPYKNICMVLIVRLWASEFYQEASRFKLYLRNCD